MIYFDCLIPALVSEDTKKHDCIMFKFMFRFMPGSYSWHKEEEGEEDTYLQLDTHTDTNMDAQSRIHKTLSA